MNYSELLSQGREALQQAEVPDAATDAWLLLNYITKMPRSEYLMKMVDEVPTQQKRDYTEAVARRCDRVPLQHITGTQSFMGLDFKVNEHVLIPRQDTEVLVERALGLLKPGDRILDLCTGSGCILLSLLKLGPTSCAGAGVDISREALEVARENAESLGLQATFLLGDLFAALPTEEHSEASKFNLITSNPPYIPSRVISTLMPEVRDHEPHLALDGTADGLEFYRRICQEAPSYLEAGGHLVFEIGHDQGEAVAELMRSAGFEGVTVEKDLAENDRVVYGHNHPA